MQTIKCLAENFADQANLHKIRGNLQELPKRWLSRVEQPEEHYMLGAVTGDCNYHFTFRLEGVGYFQTGVLVASAETAPGGMPVPLRCKWRRRVGDGNAVEIPGVTSNMYQISADDVGTHILVEAEPADADDGMFGRVCGEIGPFELDPATRRSLDNALGTGGSRFIVAQPKAPGESQSPVNRQDVAIYVSIDSLKVVPIQGGAERSNRELVVEYSSEFPKIIIHPLDTTKFQLIMSEARQFHLVAASRTARDLIVLTVRCFHARRHLSMQVLLQDLLPIVPNDSRVAAYGGNAPTNLPPPNSDGKLDACILLERLTKELNRAMQQKDLSEKVLRNTNNETKQLQSQLMETISGFTEVIEGIQDQFGSDGLMGTSTPSVSPERLQEQLRDLNSQNQALQAQTQTDRGQLERLKKVREAAPPPESAAGDVHRLREERNLLQSRWKELSSSSSSQNREQADQVHAHELKRLRQDVEMLHNHKEQLRKQLQDSEREQQELKDNFLYVKGQLDKVQMKQAHAAADSSEVQRHRQTLEHLVEERNRLSMRLEGVLREVEKEKGYHEQSLERVMTANGRLLEEKDRVAKEVQRLSQLYAESVQQLQGKSDSLSNTSGVFRMDSIMNTSNSIADADLEELAAVKAELEQVDGVLMSKEQENEGLKMRIRKLAVT